MRSLTIGIREAKAQLSRLISEAEQGTEWIITDRGRAVAKLVPVVDLSIPLEHRIARLEKWGWLEAAPTRQVSLPEPVKISADAQQALRDDRGD
ncbi:MAG TPA: type II toxin-antitoxin system prevent-host-death family antitoxin [Candidatus Dormibacteraeota bacterium]